MPRAVVGNIYIIYNSLRGNGPPNFVDWVEVDSQMTGGGAADLLVNNLPADCTDKVYATKSGALFAVPQCVVFPEFGDPPGVTRDASQVISCEV